VCKVYIISILRNTLSVSDVSVDFASDPYDANSAVGYGANLDANSDLANYVPDTKVDLGEHLVQTLRRTRRRSDALEGCFHAAGLKL